MLSFHVPHLSDQSDIQNRISPTVSAIYFPAYRSFKHYGSLLKRVVGKTTTSSNLKIRPPSDLHRLESSQGVKVRSRKGRKNRYRLRLMCFLFHLYQSPRKCQLFHSFPSRSSSPTWASRLLMQVPYRVSENDLISLS